MKRIEWIDILRGIAIFFVVLGHTFNGGVIQTYIYSFHVALFFFISGLVFNNKDKFLDFLKKKFLNILVPYYAFGMISILVYSLFGKMAATILGRGDMSNSLLVCLKGLVIGSSKNGLLKFNLPLWFLPCLFCTSLIFYLCSKLLKDKFIYVVPLGFGIISYLLNNFTNVNLPFGLGNSMTMLVFFSIGYIFKMNKDKFKFKNIYGILGLVLLVIGGYVGIRNGRVKYSVDIYNNYLLFYVGSLLSILGYTLVSMFIKKSMILEEIGRKSLTILVLHKFIIVFFQSFVFKDLMANNNVLIGVFVSIITIIIMIICDIVLRKFLPFLYGKWYRDKIV